MFLFSRFLYNALINKKKNKKSFIQCVYGEIYTHIYTVYGNTKYEKSFHENNIMTVILLIMVQWGPDIEKTPSASKIERTLTSRAFFFFFFDRSSRAIINWKKRRSYVRLVNGPGQWPQITKIYIYIYIHITGDVCQISTTEVLSKRKNLQKCLRLYVRCVWALLFKIIWKLWFQKCSENMYLKYL